jgi:hypothetical protein
MSIISRSYLKRSAETYLAAAAKPTALRAILCNFTDLSLINSQTAIADILAAELPEANGYARTTLSTTPTSSAWNPSSSAWEITWNQSYSAVGASLVYNAGVILFQGSTTANKTASINPSTNRLTVTAHGLTNADPVTLTVDTGGTYPSNGQSVTGSTLLYAKSIDANTIELYTDVALTTIVDFTDSGSGTRRIRYAKGDWDVVVVPVTPVTIIADSNGVAPFVVGNRVIS